MSTHGVQTINTYTAMTAPQIGAALLAMFPDPEAAGSSGAVPNPAGVNNYLDEMSPGCALMIHAEIKAIQARLAVL